MSDKKEVVKAEGTIEVELMMMSESIGREYKRFQTTMKRILKEIAEADSVDNQDYEMIGVLYETNDRYKSLTGAIESLMYEYSDRSYTQDNKSSR